MSQTSVIIANACTRDIAKFHVAQLTVCSNFSCHTGTQFWIKLIGTTIPSEFIDCVVTGTESSFSVKTVATHHQISAAMNVSGDATPVLLPTPTVVKFAAV